jgi:hypothetical protein
MLANFSKSFVLIWRKFSTYAGHFKTLQKFLNYEEKKMPGILAKAPKPKTSSRPSSLTSTNSQYLLQSPVVSTQSGTSKIAKAVLAGNK